MEKVEKGKLNIKLLLFPNIIALGVLGLDPGYLNLAAAAKHMHKS